MFLLGEMGFHTIANNARQKDKFPTTPEGSKTSALQLKVKLTSQEQPETG